MIDKKELIFAVLATFCLTATLFMVVPTKSQAGSYDARTDVNGDGTIDMADISMGVEGFMTNGDPTLDVNVMNWPSSQPVRMNWTGHATKLIKAAEGEEVVSQGVWGSSPILVDGYSKVSICIRFDMPTNQYYLLDYDGSASFMVDTVINFNYELVRTYDVSNQYVVLTIVNREALHGHLWVDVYLVA